MNNLWNIEWYEISEKHRIHLICPGVYNVTVSWIFCTTSTWCREGGFLGFSSIWLNYNSIYGFHFLIFLYLIFLFTVSYGNCIFTWRVRILEWLVLRWRCATILTCSNSADSYLEMAVRVADFSFLWEWTFILYILTYQSRFERNLYTITPLW